MSSPRKSLRPSMNKGTGGGSMKKQAMRLWLKTWPKLLVTICGVAVYLSSGWFPEAHQSLYQSIAVNLISIPIIFILYDIWNEKSHRKLYEHVYRYAGNEMSLAMSAAKQEMEGLAYGLYSLLDNTGCLVDDSNLQRMKVVIPEGSQVTTDEDGEEYLTGDDCMPPDAYEADQDIYAFDNATIVPVVSETKYLGFQVKGIQVLNIVERIDGLIKNSFVMERMDDKEASIIVQFHQSLRMLQSFIEHHQHDLFLRTDLSVKGFRAEKVKEALFGFCQIDLHITPDKPEGGLYKALVGSNMLQENDLEHLTDVYVINPDYYVIFGDLVVGVVDCIRSWKKETKHAGYMNFEDARIGVL